MRTQRLALMAAVLTPAAVAWTVATHLATLQPDSRLWVSGTSTVRSFECKATEIGAKIEAASPEIARDVVSGQKSVQTVVVKVAPAKLDCANGTMNEHMLKAVKAKDNPLIEFRMSSYDIVRSEAATAGTINGTLSLGGVQKDITLQATGSVGPNGTLHVVGSYPLLMTDYGLKPPSLMMGTMKVGNKVTVNFDLLVK